MRKLLVSIVVLLVFLVAAALVAPSFVDWNQYKAQATNAVRDATGRELTIKGDLDIAILPTPRLYAADISLANANGATDPEMVRIKSLAVQVKLLPLLEGRVEVGSVTLDAPVINLEQMANGRGNWEFAPAGASAAKSGGGAPPPFSLDLLHINGGAVNFRSGGKVQRVAGIKMDLSAGSLAGPFNAAGDLIAAGIPLTLKAAVGALKEGEGAAPFTLSVALPSGGGEASINGTVAALAKTPRLTGKLTAKGENFSRFVAAISGGSRTELPPALAKPWLLSAQVTGAADGGRLSDLNIEFGKVRAAGSAALGLGGKRPDAGLKLQVTRVNLNEWMQTAPAAKPGSPPAAVATKPAFALPDLDATIEVGIDGLAFRGQEMRGVEFRGKLDQKGFQLERAGLLLPGGGDAKLFGRLWAADGKPAYDSRLEIRTGNLRNLLAAFGTDLSNVPAGRLVKTTLAARLSGNTESLQLSAAKLTVDSTTIDAAANIALRARPAFGANVTINQIDLDAYMAPRGKDKKPAGKKANSGTAPGPLDMLKAFDANLRLSVGRLVYNKMPVSGISFDGTLSGGNIAIKNASVRDAAGARAAISGKLSNLDSFPVFDGSVSASSRNASRTLQLLGVELPPNARRLGGLTLKGRAKTGGDALSLNVDLSLAGGSTSIGGKVEKISTAPLLDIRAKAKYPELVTLLALAGTETAVSKLGPATADITLKGGLEKLVAALNLSAAGGRIAARGNIGDLVGKPSFDMTLAVTHPAVGTLAKNFAPRYQPQGGAIGPLKLEAALTGGNDNYKLSSLTLNAGKAALTGTAELKTGGARPALTGRLAGNLLDMNPFLPPQDKSASANQSRRASAGGRSSGSGGASSARPSEAYFPKTPFDTAVFGLLDADLAIKASGLIYRQFRVDAPTIEVTLKDRVLDVKQVAGKMFDGAFSMTGQYDTRRRHLMKSSVNVSKANIGKALFQAAAFDLRDGITDFSMNLTGTGRSPHEMIRSLNGGGKLASRDGIIKGFDLDRVNDRLKNLNRAIDFLSLFQDTMSGGQTKFNSLTGSFVIKNGVLTSKDITLLANAGEGRAEGVADLPKWHMDFIGQFRLSGHKSSPPFGMRAVGPLNDPKRIFKIDQLQSFLLQRGVGSIINNLLGGRRQQGGSQPQPDQTQPAQQQQQSRPEKVTPETIIRDVLPGLFGGGRR